MSAALAALLLLFVSSGAALQVHERLEHRDFAGPSVAASASGGVLLAGDRAIEPGRPLHSHSHDECPTCDQLHHAVAVAAVLLFVFGLFATVVTFRPALLGLPALAAFASPRSSRGPPLFA